MVIKEDTGDIMNKNTGQQGLNTHTKIVVNTSRV